MKTVALAMLCLLASCRQPEGEATKPAPVVPPTPAAPSAPVSSSTTAPVENAQAVLDRMDTRAAVPLLPMMANHQKQNMRDHLLVVQEIVLATATDDFASVEKAVTRMGFSEQMGQMCTHMGAGAPGFTERALKFHHTADSIAAAARKRDRKRVLDALGTTLRQCTECHAAFRQRVVDQGTWTSLTGNAPPEHSPGH